MAAALVINDELLNELSGLNDESFDRLLHCAINNSFVFPQDAEHVQVPLAVSSLSHVSISDGSAVADAVVIHDSADRGQPASALEEFTMHSDIGPSASSVYSRYSCCEPESIEDIDLAIAEAEVKVLKAKRSLALRSKPSSNASLSSLRVDPKFSARMKA
jgi:hypothetical protein